MIFSVNQYPELISLHIPKTAGTSFRNILKNVYGDNEVVRFDIDEKDKATVNENPYTSLHLPKVKVIHGHFVFESLINKFPLPKNHKIITWVRDPVKRVVSNYFYLESRLKDVINEENRNINILSKMQRTLIEYARSEINRNRQTKFLKGSQLEDYFFVGIHEYFQDEISRLSNAMNWKKIPDVLHHNRTVEEKPLIHDDILDEIRQLNLADADLYEKALQLRNQE